MSTDARPEGPAAAPLARAARLIVIVVLSFAGSGCESLATYGKDRMRDFSDIVDVRYGTGVGLGVMVEAGPLESGLGCAIEWYYRRWFGRKPVDVRDGLFAYGIIAGFEGDYVRRLGPHDWVVQGNTSTGSLSILFLDTGAGQDRPTTGTEEWFTQPGGNPPLLTSARVGGSAFLVVVSAGMYFNAGELLDFVCGVFGGDPMHDDGVPKYRVATGSEPAPPKAPSGLPPMPKAPAAKPALDPDAKPTTP